MRRREISPEFWTDEKVVGISDGAKLLFIGLWNLADREGRLEDRPLTIGLKVRPWDAQSAAGLLNEIAEAGLVVRYSAAGGRALMCIPQFKRHQHPHPREVQSGLPGPEQGAPEAPPRTDQSTAKEMASPAGSSGSSGSSGSRRSAPAVQPSLALEGQELEPKARRRRLKIVDADDAASQREVSDVLCATFHEVIGSEYVWQGAKDGVALAELLKSVTPPEVDARWRVGLQAPATAWASCRTVAQLRSKWNDLAPAVSFQAPDGAPDSLTFTDLRELP
ncbi:MAG: hypothetical protein AMXMBFR56_72900 [Polyangiaceae bacterium]